MCNTPKIETPKVAPQILAAPRSADANKQADIAARYRRARSGTLANILTSPLGIPSGATSQLGAPQ
ncbi:hypothetical protein CDO87_03450 [Sagittula sp. P11]|uniref:hypothetical protein n=1 Tax=Sagittula sp. P11 TaxID=2009329 RepID=UPI000C2D217B|nr:hypothetical protein [Sagittula sp. P11]AUC52301.1 hypothetical protein CDO87_03450 [Sagittula sp. P11]